MREGVPNNQKTNRPTPTLPVREGVPNDQTTKRLNNQTTKQPNDQTMKERIRQILEDNLPLVDVDSDYLFAELSSLDITTIMMLLSEEYGVELGAADVTPKNFMTVDSIVEMVKRKQ